MLRPAGPNFTRLAVLGAGEPPACAEPREVARGSK
jgi:hypothetical protein